MKNSQGLTVVLCIMYLCVGSVESQDNLFTGETVDFLEKNMDVFECSGATYDWITKGKLYLYVATRSSRPMCYFRYVTNDGSTEVFTDNTLANISEILEQEAILNFDIKTVKKMVGGLVLSSMAGRNASLIDRDYIKNYGYDVADGDRPNFLLMQLTALLKKNENEGVKVRHNGNKWQATFNIVTIRGGVEWWCVCGSTNPLNVEKVERKVICKNNKIKPVL